MEGGGGQTDTKLEGNVRITSILSEGNSISTCVISLGYVHMPAGNFGIFLPQ